MLFFLLVMLLSATRESDARPQENSATGNRSEKIRFFENSVRPILVTHCLDCHGSLKQESGLRLDHLAHMLRGGDSGPALIPGKPDRSLLFQAINHTDGLEMPPETRLADQQIRSIRKWILEGATWPEEKVAGDANRWKQHWAFQPVAKPLPPRFPEETLPIQNDIDRFVGKKLLARQLAPSPPATERELVRRTYLDLLGLPPTYEQVKAYLAQPEKERFKNLVDRLLDSPRYGERQARHWMDIARYADNKGYVFFEDKNYPWAYTYRDWLIRAFNEDMPYDQFILRQLAADQFDPLQDRSHLPALGFLTVGAKFVNNVHDQIDDRIDVVTRGLMGLTVTCARCHDHKFDPIPQADYYALYGVFRSCYEPVVLPTFEPEPETAAYRDYQEGLKQRLQKLESFIRDRRQEIMQGARERLGDYLLAVHQRRHHPSTENFMTITDKGSLNPKIISRYETYLNRTRKLDHPVWKAWHALSGLEETEFQKRALPTLEKVLRPGNRIHPLVRTQFVDLAPKSLAEVATAYGQLFQEVARQHKADASQLSQPQRELADILFGKDSPAVLPNILGWGFLDLIPDRPTQGVYQKLITDVENFCKSGPQAPARAMVVLDSDPPFEPYVFLRGNPNRKGISVKRQFLTSLPNTESIRSVFPENRSGRLQLAQAIASRENPLTARVIVNRIWRQHFGEGLVSTPSDFGIQGTEPSHPQLLDWLANWFMDHGWSIKKLHRLIMGSATFQRSSRVSIRQQEADPENRWLSRFRRRRLDFESMRDSLLLTANSLDSRIGGKPFPLFSGFQNRRSLYGFINRMDLPGVLRTFDYPEPAATSGKREQTTVPAQALFFLNHPFVTQCSEKILQRQEIRTAVSVEEKTNAVFRSVFARDANPEELQLVIDYLPAREISRPATAWRYGYGSLDAETGKTGSFKELPYFTGTHWQGGPSLPDPKLNWLYHKNDESHPGASMELCSIRRWVAPRDCTVRIDGLLNHQPTQGNGIRSRIISSRSGTLGSWTVHHSKTRTPVSRLTVKAGDTVDFLSDFNSNISYDQHKWSIVVESIEGKPARWDSVRQFEGPETSAWLTLVQGLLMTNEFLFVD
ncbi:MAG: PSD1 and planctomycete cytochrome C domain-containing protein [Planctomycetota bacterium]|nr:PSD1 and planctomycete cytochrome C domain-containing protein [Planctomycetota bacterium]